jgi:hypothetical protein
VVEKAPQVQQVQQDLMVLTEQTALMVLMVQMHYGTFWVNG